MNAEDFYEEFKNALNFLGLGWSQKHLAKVFIKDGAFWMCYGSRTVSLKLPTVAEGL